MYRSIFLRRAACAGLSRALLPALLPALLMAAAPVPARPSAGDASAEAVVQCAGGRSFSVRLGAGDAVVQVGGRTLLLARRPSPNIRHYGSAEAALAVDGDFVAFVMADALNFDACRLTRETAQESAASASP
ncbi:MAG: hypothetical protein QM690_02255 [Sphingobium sp.]